MFSTELSTISYFHYSTLAEFIYGCLTFYVIVCLLNPITDWVKVVDDNTNKMKEEIASLKEEIALLKSKLEEQENPPSPPRKKVTFDLPEEEVKKCKICDGTEFSKPTNLICVKCNSKKRGKN